MIERIDRSRSPECAAPGSLSGGRLSELAADRLHLAQGTQHISRSYLRDIALVRAGTHELCEEMRKPADDFEPLGRDSPEIVRAHDRPTSREASEGLPSPDSRTCAHSGMVGAILPGIASRRQRPFRLAVSSLGGFRTPTQSPQPCISARAKAGIRCTGTDMSLRRISSNR